MTTIYHFLQHLSDSAGSQMLLSVHISYPLRTAVIQHLEVAAIAAWWQALLRLEFFNQKKMTCDL